MDISIFLFLYKVRMGLEIEFFRMLKDEICTWMKNVLRKHLIRNVCKAIKGVRGIRKDKVELFTAYLQKFENIMSDYSQVIHSEFRRL